MLRKILAPFSHLPGESCLLPGSSWSLTAYPTRVCLEDQKQNQATFSLKLTGPIEGFTVMQDLNRGYVTVYGKAKEGFFSYRLQQKESGITLTVKRCPGKGLDFTFEKTTRTLLRNETFCFPLSVDHAPLSPEWIHFGCHKKQDWPLVKRRLELSEILPIWFALGKNTPPGPLHHEGSAALLNLCEKAIETRNKEEIDSAFLTLFRIGFKGILTPRLVDDEHQGVPLSTSQPDASPLVLLSHGAQLIRRLFIEVEGETVALLPCLPPELHAGECHSMEILPGLALDCTWSKKELKTVMLHVQKERTLHLQLPKKLKHFRLRQTKREKGKRIERDAALSLKSGTYFLDRFEK